MSVPAKEFWTSRAARHFPYSLEIHGSQWQVTEQEDYYRKLFKRLDGSGWIPQYGNILELGAGASSGLLFPKEIMCTRITATDISRLLLARNPVPEKNKYILDAGIDTYPGQWNGQFSLVVAQHLSRYLYLTEKVHLAQETHRVLAPAGRILIIDTPQTPNRDVAVIIGEVSPFETDRECGILQGTGFVDVRYGTYFVEFFNYFHEHTGTHIDYVTATTSVNSFAR